MKSLSSDAGPYMSIQEQTLTLHDGSLVFVRPIKFDDEERIKSLLQRVSQEDLRFRFFGTIKEFTHEFLSKLVSLDYTRAMAFVAFDKTEDDLLGVVRLHSDLDKTSGEFAILLRTDAKGRGLGWALMKLMIQYAKSVGIQLVHGQVLLENTVMLEMCSELGFRIAPGGNERGVHRLVLNLYRS